MSRNVLLNIALTPILEHDVETDRFMVYFKEFPQAFAIGKTEDEAEDNLVPIIELMWREKPSDLAKTLFEKYVNDAHRIQPEITKQ